jgi:hypothetical protein
MFSEACYASERLKNRFRTGRKQVRSSRTKQAGRLTSITLDNSLLEPFEIGALIDAVLCYSTWPAERVKDVATAICADVVQCWAKTTPEIKAEYPHYKKSLNRTSLRSLQHRREKALKFGLAFLPMLKEAATGQMPIFNGRQRGLSEAEIVQFIWPEPAAHRNFSYDEWLHDRRRELRNHRPIAHLAAAYQYVARELSGANAAASMDYEDLNLHRSIVERANRYAGYFRATPALKHIDSKLIDIEWRD